MPMKEHRGMRPQDVVVLLKMISLGDREWYFKDIASGIGISNSEVSEAVNRSLQAGLVTDDKKAVEKDRLLEFLVYGLRYVFPAVNGRLEWGMPTAHSCKLLEAGFAPDIPWVWPVPGGEVKGAAVTPLYHTVPDACARDRRLYEMLALADALRVGRPDEKKAVVEKLAEVLYSGG